MITKNEIDRIIIIGIFVSILIGLLVTLYFILAIREPFSVLYIKPDSYSNYIVNNTVSFIYGVRCLEGKKTRYTAEIFLGDIPIGNNTFEMDGGEKEWVVSADLPADIDTRLPVKVKVVLRGPTNVYDVHFWLKGRK